MEDNPYTVFLRILREQASGQIPVLFREGTVISASPLKIEVSETVQSGDRLRKDEGITEFRAGDSVLLMSLDGNQTFIIICKVVGV